MTKSRNASLFTAYLVLFLDNFGFAVVFTLFPLLFLHNDVSILPVETTVASRNLLLGFILASFPLAQFFGAPYFGDIADRYGRKKALSFTIIGTFFGYLLSALAILTTNFYLLLFSRILTGFFAGNLSLCMTIVSDFNTGKKAKARSLSIATMLLGISWIVAILVGALFANPSAFSLMRTSLLFILIAVATLISLIFLKAYFIESHAPAARTKKGISVLKAVHNVLHVFESKNLRLLYLILFLWFLGFGMAMQWATPIAIEKFHASYRQILWFLIFMGICWTFASGVLNNILVKWVNLWQLIIWSLLGLSICYFFAGVGDFFPYYLILFGISSIFAAISWSNSLSLIALAANEDEKAKALGVGSSMTALAEFLGPCLGGVIAAMTIEPLLYAAAIFVFIAFFLLFGYFIKNRKSIA